MVEFQLPDYLAHIGLLLVRVIIAVAFFVSGIRKYKNGIKKFAVNHDLPVGMGYFVATAEIAGSIGIMTGVLAQWAALGLMLLMLSTISLHIFKWKSPYWASEGGWEYDLMLFALCSVILFYGAGAVAVTYWIL